MPTEYQRTTSVRKVCPKPGEGSSVKLKVIDQISFIDAKSQYQEFQFSLNNTPTAERVTFSEKVSNTLDVERIKSINVVDEKSQYQESLFSFLRYQQGVHLETHKAKIYALKPDGTKDTTVWIEVERVDRISFVDPKSQYQEYIYELKWPDLADPEWDYQNLTPVVTGYDNSSINPPWRLDPFQNIVSASFDEWNFIVIEVIADSHSTPSAVYQLRSIELSNSIQPLCPSGEISGNIFQDPYKFILWAAYADNATLGPRHDLFVYDIKEAAKLLPANNKNIIFEVRSYWIMPSGTPPSMDATIKLSLVSAEAWNTEEVGFIGLKKEKVETVATVTVTEIDPDPSAPTSSGQVLARLSYSIPNKTWKLV